MTLHLVFGPALKRPSGSALRFAMALTLAVLLTACSREQAAAPPATTKNAKSATIPVELTGYNHTDKTIGAFYVNGQWGGNITPGSGGGSFVCCVALPNPWHPDMKVRVRWEDQDGAYHEQDVSVPAYDAKETGGLNVHFLRSGEIRVFAGMIYLGHPDYPLKGKEADLKPGVPIQLHK
jgi:hypothetical protein